jgi:hypothetical protein
MLDEKNHVLTRHEPESLAAAKIRKGRMHNRGAQRGTEASLALLRRAEDYLRRNESKAFIMADLDVSRMIVLRYVRIFRQLSSGLRIAVERLELSVTAAAMIARFPQPYQIRIARAYIRGIIGSSELRQMTLQELLQKIGG